MTQEHRLTDEQLSLPEGYNFVDKSQLQPDEIIGLRESVGWDGDTTEQWQNTIDQPLGVIVGVRDEEGSLVGMGRMTADPRHVVLCDLVVDPEHQHKGIAAAIVGERMRIADLRNIPFMYTDLSPTNPLKGLYDKLGFVATGGGLFRDGR